MKKLKNLEEGSFLKLFFAFFSAATVFSIRMETFMLVNR
mgnify:FL=1